MCSNKPRTAQRCGRQAGVTLVELMVALAIFAILVGMAAPSMTSVMLGPRLGSWANDFSASATLARSEAIKRNATVTLCASSDGAACATAGGWEQGWIVLAGTEVISRRQALPAAYKGTETLAGALSLVFQPSGAGSTQASIRFCQFSPSAGSVEKVVTLTATGRTGVSTTHNSACS